MLGSPIQQNNLINLLFSARKTGGIGTGKGTGDATQQTQQEFLHFFNAVKTALQQTQTQKQKPLEKIGVPEKSAAKAADKVATPEKAPISETRPSQEEAPIAETTQEASKPETPLQELTDLLAQLTTLVQQWQETLPKPITPGETLEVPEEIEALTPELTQLLQDIQALQDTLPQPATDATANTTPLVWIQHILEQPEAMTTLTQKITPHELLPLLKAMAQQTGDTKSPITQALENIAVPEIETIATPELAKVTELLEKLPETLQTPEQTPPPVVDGIKMEKVLTKMAAVLEQAPPEAKEALQEVTTKLRSLADVLAERPKGKSIPQMQFEAMMAPTQPSGETLAPESPAQGNAFSNLTMLSTVSTHSVVEGLNQIAGAGGETANFGIPDNQNVTFPSPQDQVVDAVKMTIQAGKKEISIKLMPSELGEVRLTLNSNAQQQVSARLITETPEAKVALEKNLDQLIRSLESSGLKIGKIQIVEAGQTAENNNQFNDNHSNSQNGATSHQEQQRQQQQSLSFNNGTGSSFTDGGSSQAGDDTSSSQTFDTDVEGEEVSATPPTIRDDGSVDVRI